MRYLPLLRILTLTKRPTTFATALLLCLGTVPSQSPRCQTRAEDKNLAIVLWAREVNRHALYWINDKPVGRDSLGGLIRAFGSTDPDNVRLTVILDSRLMIDEIHQIDGMLDKIPIAHVRYFMFWVDDPRSMQEIVLKSEFTPVPKPLPHAPTEQ